MGPPAHQSSVCNRNRRSNQAVKPGLVCTQCRHCSKCGSTATSLDVDHQPDCRLCRQPIAYFQETLACGHSYHGDCLFRWLKKHVTCPTVKNVCPKCGLLPPGGTTLPSTKATVAQAERNGHNGRPLYSRSNSSSSESSSTSSSSGSSRSSRASDRDVTSPTTKSGHRDRKSSTGTEKGNSSDSDSGSDSGHGHHRSSARGYY